MLQPLPIRSGFVLDGFAMSSALLIHRKLCPALGFRATLPALCRSRKTFL
jgi:hypothetical protein